MPKYNVEVTDTFGGEANYCWVHRHKIDVPEREGELPKAYDRRLVMAAKAAEGWTGHKCDTQNLGDEIHLRPRGLLQIMFIVYDDTPGEDHATAD